VNFPPSNVSPDERFTHAYFNQSKDGGSEKGFHLAQSQGLWNFENGDPYAGGNEPDLPDAKPSVVSALDPLEVDEAIDQTSRARKSAIRGTANVN
jgi:hypothetical protein